MRFITMGQQENPAILFIPGLSATAESCYGEVGRLLQGDRQIILCELDGHYDGSPSFLSINRECEQIEDYVTEHFQGRQHGMVGLSLGGTIAVSILSRRKIQVKKAVLDAAFCVDMGILKGFFTRTFPLGVERIREGKYVPGFVIDMLMGKGNRSIVQMLYPGITADNCRNACRDIYSYRISENLKNTRAAVEFWRGSREPYPKKSAALLKEYIPSMTERIFPDMGHCQFLHEHPQEYAGLLNEYMGRNEHDRQT